MNTPYSLIQQLHLTIKHIDLFLSNNNIKDSLINTLSNIKKLSKNVIRNVITKTRTRPGPDHIKNQVQTRSRPVSDHRKNLSNTITKIVKCLNNFDKSIPKHSQNMVHTRSRPGPDHMVQTWSRPGPNHMYEYYKKTGIIDRIIQLQSQYNYGQIKISNKLNEENYKALKGGPITRDVVRNILRYIQT
jgi:hypothetical protein